MVSGLGLDADDCIEKATGASTGRAQSRGTVSQALARIRQAASTALLHRINIDALGIAFFALKHDARFRNQLGER